MSTTTILPWEQAFADLRATFSDETQRLLRRHAADALVRRGATEVGSSDVSHELYSRYSRCGSWQGVVLDFVDELGLTA